MGKRYLADKEHGHDVSDVTGAAKTSDHKWREYNDLSDVGITKGSETFEAILAEMPNYSQLSYVTTGANNQSIYPYVGGICEIKKLTNIYAKITFSMPSGGVKRGLYEKYCDYKNSAWVISEWYKFYNELTPPTASDVGALGYAGEMSANDDLNNYKTIGSYTATSAVTATLSNCPFSSGASQLYVLATGGDTNPLLQIATQSTTLNTNLYVRKHVSNGWTDWKQFAFTDKFLPIGTTASDVGAFATNTSATVFTGDCNNLTDGSWSVTGSATNTPDGQPCMIYHKSYDSNFAEQMSFNFSTWAIKFRYKVAGAWKDWTPHFLPLDGSESMTGNILSLRNGYLRLASFNQCMRLDTRNVANNDQNMRGLWIADSSKSDGLLGDAFRLVDVTEGKTSLYKIHGDHNKPTGSYTGNGSSALRSIEIPNARSSVIVIWSWETSSSSGQTFAILGSTGGVAKDAGGTLKPINFSEARFTPSNAGYHINMYSTSNYLNQSGRTYEYRIL